MAVGLLLTALCGVGAGLFVHRIRAADPADAEVSPPAVVEPVKHSTPARPRVRYLSLAEARAIALENALFFHPPMLRVDSLEGLALTPRDATSVRVLADVTAKGQGIVLTGIPRSVPRAKLECYANQMLLNIETAYWNLYGSYWQLHTREQGLRSAYETWKMVLAEYKAGRVSLADLAQAEGQYNLFRSQRMQALDTVCDNERQLRAMLGMPPEDHLPPADLEPFKIKTPTLVPSDTPTLVEMKPDWEKGLAAALKQRPELRMARQNLSKTEEDSPERQRAQLVLQDQELKAERFLGLCYRRMSSAYAQIKAARKQREAFATQIRVRRKNYEADKKTATLDLILEAERFWTDALATEYQAIVTYNAALTGWEYVQGAILEYAHIRLDYDPPADENEVRAVVYEQMQTLTKVRRVRTGEKMDDHADRGQRTADISLPSLWMAYPPLRGAEELPSAESVDPKKTQKYRSPIK